MNKKLLLTFSFLMIGLFGFSQIQRPNNYNNRNSSKTKDSTQFWRKLRYGINIPQIGFSSGGGTIAIAPVVSYPITNDFSCGLMFQVNYTWRRVQYIQGGVSKTYKDDILVLAPDFFLQYNISKEFFIRADVEYATYKAYDGITINSITYEPVKVRYNILSPFIGVGYRSEFAYIFAQYNPTWDSQKSLYASPFRFGGGFYFN